MRVRVSPIPPPQSSKGRAPENDRSRHRKRGARTCFARAAAGEVRDKGCARWGELRVADAPGSSRTGDQGSAFPKWVLCERYAGSSPAWGTVICGHRSTVGPQSSKLPMRVRFPLPAPSRFSERSAVCKTAREGLIPSRLSAPRARWTSTRLLSEPIRVRVPGGALASPTSSTEEPSRPKR